MMTFKRFENTNKRIIPGRYMEMLIAQYDSPCYARETISVLFSIQMLYVLRSIFDARIMQHGLDEVIYSNVSLFSLLLFA